MRIAIQTRNNIPMFDGWALSDLTILTPGTLLIRAKDCGTPVAHSLSVSVLGWCGLGQWVGSNEDMRVQDVEKAMVISYDRVKEEFLIMTPQGIGRIKIKQTILLGLRCYAIFPMKCHASRM